MILLIVTSASYPSVKHYSDTIKKNPGLFHHTTESGNSDYTPSFLVTSTGLRMVSFKIRLKSVDLLLKQL